MVGIVRVALERPYTFVVAAILVLLLGTMSAIKTAKDIFPDIGIPVISVIWTYAGLPPDDMSGRIVTIYERALTATVSDIEHIESQSVPGFGIVKIYFQPARQRRRRAGPGDVDLADHAQADCRRASPRRSSSSTTRRACRSCSSRCRARRRRETELNDLASNFVRPPLANVAGAALPNPYGGMPRQVQIDLDQRALQSYGLSAQDVVNALAVQNLITPAGTEKIGSYEYTVNLNVSPGRDLDFNNLPIKPVNGAMVYMRDVAYAHDGSPPQTNVVRVDGRKARADDGAEDRVGIDARYHRGHQAAAAAHPRDLAGRGRAENASAISRGS